ncbi:MAG: V-type ATPase 116kDa subunit family protein, partial [Nanoarchaeota archaeon]
MIKVKDMSKLTVFGPKTYMKSVIAELYDLNVVHIEEFTKKSEEDYFDIGEPYKENEGYAEILVKLRTMISKLGLKKTGRKPSTESIKEIESKTNELYNQTTALLKNEEYLLDIKRTYDKKNIENALSSLKIESENNLSSMTHYVGFVNTSEAKLREKIENITTKFELSLANYDGMSVMALFVGAKKQEKIEKLLKEYDFSPIDNPQVKKQFKLKSKSGAKFVKEDYQFKIITEKLEAIQKKLDRLKENNSKFLEESETKLKIETEKAEAPLRIATTKSTFLIKGWIPTENKEKLDSSLNKITKGKVMVEFEKPKKKETPPIAFNHPKIVEPFEAFMELYTLPSYKEIDPTFFMFLTFPIFFGFMLGDVGYGLIILTLFMILKKKMPGAKNFLNVFIISSIVSIVFGMVFGEYFGFEEVSPALGNVLGIHPEEVL